MLHYHGPITDDLWLVLRTCWKRPLSLQCDFARQNAREVALAASMGLISSIDPDGRDYRHHWRITAAGITALEHKELME